MFWLYTCIWPLESSRGGIRAADGRVSRRALSCDSTAWKVTILRGVKVLSTSCSLITQKYTAFELRNCYHYGGLVNPLLPHPMVKLRYSPSSNSLSEGWRNLEFLQVNEVSLTQERSKTLRDYTTKHMTEIVSSSLPQFF